jgi:hypothetical protein
MQKGRGKLVLVLVTLAAFLGSSPCSLIAAEAAKGNAGDYILQRGDRLTLSLKISPDYGETTVVGKNLVAESRYGKVSVAGMTVVKAARAFADKLKPQFPDDTLILKVQTTKGRVITVSLQITPPPPPPPPAPVPVPVPAATPTPATSTTPVAKQTVAPKRSSHNLVGWSSVLVGAACTGLGVMTTSKANKAYKDYKKAATTEDAADLYDKTLGYDRQSYVYYGLGAAGVLAGSFLLTLGKSQAAQQKAWHFDLEDNPDDIGVRVALLYSF